VVLVKTAAIFGIVGGGIGLPSIAMSMIAGGSPEFLRISLFTMLLSLLGIVGGMMALKWPRLGGLVMLIVAAAAIKFVDVLYALAAPPLITGGLLALYGGEWPPAARGSIESTRGRTFGLRLDGAWLVACAAWMLLVAGWGISTSAEASKVASALGRQSDTTWIRLAFWTAELAPFAVWAILLANFSAAGGLTPGMVVARGDKRAVIDALFSHPLFNWRRAGLVLTCVAIATSVGTAVAAQTSERNATNEISARLRGVSVSASSADPGELLFGPVTGDLGSPSVAGSHTVDGPNARRAGQQLTDFILEARFSNPEPAGRPTGGWSYGIFFRDDGQARYQVIITWNPNLRTPTQFWRLERVSPGANSGFAAGEHSSLNTAADASNLVRLFVKGSTLVLTINDQEVTVQNLRGTGAEKGDLGVFTDAVAKGDPPLHYADFHVWTLKTG